MAVRAAHAQLEQWRRDIDFTQRVTARPAQHMLAFAQAVADRHAFVENKALALPAALRLGHRFQIFQNAAFEVIDLVKPL